MKRDDRKILQGRPRPATTFVTLMVTSVLFEERILWTLLYLLDLCYVGTWLTHFQQ